jgi:hypothetical protein
VHAVNVALVWLAVIAALAVPAVAQSEFPYDRDLVLDARAMRGGKRVPVLSIEQNGRAQIDLWCKRGDGQAAIAGDAITITVGAMRTSHARRSARRRMRRCSRHCQA